MTTPQQPQIARVVREANQGAPWEPSSGSETETLLEHLRLAPGARERVIGEALGVLRKCVGPLERAATRTGLVVGQVQSGKTLSFTTLTALARDNGYPLVIVVAGASLHLSRQSRDRLLGDLQIATVTGGSGLRVRKWKHFHNLSVRHPGYDTIANSIAEWQDPTVPESERQTVLLTVMKGHQRLAGLTNVLLQMDLANCPTLVIDDEADQAGLNTLVNLPDRSTTYSRLIALRAALPIHTYLQYTATPQAPLLINAIDTLSPHFAEVLTPGEAYIGGKDFFVDHPELVRRIGSAEVPSSTNVLREPPESLLAALRLFFVGVAAGMIVDGSRGCRSMLVHPSQETLRHAEFFRWVVSATGRWQETLALPATEQDRIDVVTEFREAYDDLRGTVRDIPRWEDILARLPMAIRRTFTREVNSSQRGRQPVDWGASYSHILVGGQAMDRGFTIEGLTVTYMPRGIGVGNADTVQQRGRFFGYKRSYLGYCRVFLEQDTQVAFTRYVRHEEHMQNALIAHRATGRPLAEWKRAFLLDPALRPTRLEVLDLDYMRHDFRDKWYTQIAVLDSPTIVEANRRAVVQLLSTIPALGEDIGDPQRTPAQRHLVAQNLPKSSVLDLLTQWRVGDTGESQKLTGLLLQLVANWDEVPELGCDLFLMSRGQDPNAVRQRGVNRDGAITYLHQGANQPTGYPGDNAIGDPRHVRIQVHHLELTREGIVLATNVPALAVYLPDAGTAVSLTQPQGRY